MPLLDVLKADWRANRDDARIVIVMTLFRVARAARGTGPRPRRWSLPLIALYKVLVAWVFTIDLPLGVQVGPGLRLQHAYGLVVHPATVIGARCTIYHGVTLGIARASDAHGPVIGDRVTVSAGASVFGPVRVGDRAMIAAGAIVLSDVPAEHTAIGAPAKARPSKLKPAP
ncbi:MAG TPA: DapH/DapD/GlmU-related protein [Baekduia sp.]